MQFGYSELCAFSTVEISLIEHPYISISYSTTLPSNDQTRWNRLQSIWFVRLSCRSKFLFAFLFEFHEKIATICKSVEMNLSQINFCLRFRTHTNLVNIQLLWKITLKLVLPLAITRRNIDYSWVHNLGHPNLSD